MKLLVTYVGQTGKQDKARTEGLAWDVEVMPPFPERCQHCCNPQSQSFSVKKRFVVVSTIIYSVALSRTFLSRA